LIGRDPRKISFEEFIEAGAVATMIGGDGLKIVRAKCLDCCVQQLEEVRKCVAVICPNWPYRMGTNPFRKQNLSEEERAARGARLKEARQRRLADQNPLAANGGNSADDPEGG
jgi:hypothetical protein